MPLSSVDLPAPFGPTTAISAPASTSSVQVMHRRVAVIAERQVAEFERRAHCQLAIAQKTAPHSTATSTATAASRSSAERRRIDGETVAGGCTWPG